MSKGREGRTAGGRRIARGALRALRGVAQAAALAAAALPFSGTPAFAAGDVTSTTISCGTGVIVGQTATCTATVTDEAGSPTTPTGSVSFASTGTGTFTPSSKECALAPVAGHETEAASCSIEYTPTAAGTGKHTITASYGGDAGHEPSSKGTVLKVAKRTTTAAVECPSGAVEEHVTCTATVTDTSPSPHSAPTGTVTFETDVHGEFSSATCELVAASEERASCTTTYTPTTTGSHEVKAGYPGDEAHEAKEAAATLAVTLRATSVSISCGSGVAVLQPAKCTATVTDTSGPVRSAPAGIVAFSPAEGTFLDSECELVPTGDGEHSSCSVIYTPAQFGSGAHEIKATYMPGETNHASSTGAETLAVHKRTSTLGLSCGGPVTVGTPATCTVSAADTSPGSASPPPGAVAVSSDTAGGSFAPAAGCTLAPTSATNESACQLTYTPGQVGSGTHTLTAAYAGDAIHAEGSGSGALAVNGLPLPPATTTTTTTAPPPPPPPSPTVPKCRLKARELARSRAAGHGRARETPVLVVTFTCDQSARVKITGTASIAASGHGRKKKKAKTLKLETATAQALVSKPQPAVIMALPSAASKALSAHVRTLVTITFTVSNEHGTGVATLRLVLVPLSQLKKAR